jgi:hypothetical protein
MAECHIAHDGETDSPVPKRPNRCPSSRATAA